MAIAIGVSAQGPGEQPRAKADPEKPPIWTAEEMINRLARQPNDAYVQFVALQLARRENSLDRVTAQIEEMNGRGRFDPGRRERVDLFSTFSGALAIQESLQLDTLAGERDARRNGPPRIEPRDPPAPIEEPVPPKPETPAENPRRGFFRRLAGRRPGGH